MVPHVLGVGYAYNEYEVTAGRWKEFEIEFDYADNIKQAAAMLSFKEYICVAICSDVIPQDDLDILRQKRAVPIIVVPPFIFGGTAVCMCPILVLLNIYIPIIILW